MKKTCFTFSSFLLFLLLGFTACQNHSSQTPSTEDAAIIKEVEKLDSLTTDLETTAKTIEEQTKELQSALDAL